MEKLLSFSRNFLVISGLKGIAENLNICAQKPLNCSSYDERKMFKPLYHVSCMLWTVKRKLALIGKTKWHIILFKRSVDTKAQEGWLKRSLQVTFYFERVATRRKTRKKQIDIPLIIGSMMVSLCKWDLAMVRET